jgi:uncharacterized membrane protein
MPTTLSLAVFPADFMTDSLMRIVQNDIMYGLVRNVQVNRRISTIKRQYPPKVRKLTVNQPLLPVVALFETGSLGFVTRRTETSILY